MIKRMVYKKDQLKKVDKLKLILRNKCSGEHFQRSNPKAPEAPFFYL